MSQEVLSAEVDVTATMIRHIRSQRGRQAAIDAQTLAVSEVGLGSVTSSWTRSRATKAAWTPTSWFAPGYDPCGHGVGHGRSPLVLTPGQVEQTLLYFDPQSAADFLATCNSAAYVAAYRTNVPLATIARHLGEQLGPRLLRVNVLGCGDGKAEALLVT